MVLNENLTNEELNKRFDNPFALVSYAISLARLKVQRGEGMESNLTTDVLKMISTNKDQMESKIVEEEL
ncbi:MAG: hypothetical protein WAM28_08810 [Chlamydiales bacterium]